MKTIYYDVSPTSPDRWVLRCAANGRLCLASYPGESNRKFITRCRQLCEWNTTPDRTAALRVFDAEGRRQ